MTPCLSVPGRVADGAGSAPIARWCSAMAIAVSSRSVSTIGGRGQGCSSARSARRKREPSLLRRSSFRFSRKMGEEQHIFRPPTAKTNVPCTRFD